MNVVLRCSGKGMTISQPYVFFHFDITTLLQTFVCHDTLEAESETIVVCWCIFLMWCGAVQHGMVVWDGSNV